MSVARIASNRTEVREVKFFLIMNSQWRIQDFSKVWGGEGSPTPKMGMLTYYFAIFLPKTG